VKGKAGVTHVGSERLTVALVRALAHPVRREALRLLHRVPGSEMSATEMSKAVTGSRQSINNHLKRLSKANAVCIRSVRLVRNATENRYGSLVSTNPTLLALLAETEAEDASIRCDSQE
jgi:DNA-binding transcriptional ArsR family regulator